MGQALDLVPRLDHAKATVIAVINHLKLTAFFVPKQVEVVVDHFQLMARLFEAHRWHGEILAPNAWARELCFFAFEQ